jgi:hypothetical protein
VERRVRRVEIEQHLAHLLGVELIARLHVVHFAQPFLVFTCKNTVRKETERILVDFFFFCCCCSSLVNSTIS